MALQGGGGSTVRRGRQARLQAREGAAPRDAAEPDAPGPARGVRSLAERSSERQDPAGADRCEVVGAGKARTWREMTMGFVYRRNDSQFLWGEWKDAAGVEQRGSLQTTDESEAQARV